MPPKRKSDANAVASSSKKQRVDDPHATAIALVDDILSDRFELPDDEDDIMKSFVLLAQYTRSLAETQTQALATSTTINTSTAAAAAAAKKSADDLEVEAEKVRKAAVAGIKKQMSWRPTCKSRSAKWSYDGVCLDPEVFGVMMRLEGPPTFKMRKFPVNAFEKLVGRIHASARYSSLRLTGDNVRWSDTGEFKFSGTYGI